MLRRVRSTHILTRRTSVENRGQTKWRRMAGLKMKVLLLQDVRDRVKKDQIVNVSDGYARNLLFPKKLAVVADKKAMRNEAQGRGTRDFTKDRDQRAAAGYGGKA